VIVIGDFCYLHFLSTQEKKYYQTLLVIPFGF